MTQKQVKTGCLVLSALNSFVTSYYFNYLFFYMQSHFGFSRKDNLWLCALNGLVYMLFAWFGGRCAQKYGYFFALRVGFGLMALALAIGSGMTTAGAQVGLMVLWTFGMCFTWPTLEGLISEGENPAGLARMVGIYNVVWAGAGAVAFFSGGALLELLGWKSLFWLPAGLHLIQIELTIWLDKRSVAVRQGWAGSHLLAPGLAPVHLNRNNPVFQKLAWVANPFAFVALNAVIPIIPSLAAKLQLTPMFAGFVCSVFYFARVGAFIGLWLWTGWHYRFSWLLGAYGALIGSFMVLLLVPQVGVLILAQIVFGLALGLIYYSSLFYSMDVGSTKDAHAGLHEAAIGAGVFAGPACGAVVLEFFPHSPSGNTWAVSGLLALGFGLLVVLRRK